MGQASFVMIILDILVKTFAVLGKTMVQFRKMTFLRRFFAIEVAVGRVTSLCACKAGLQDSWRLVCLLVSLSCRV